MGVGNLIELVHLFYRANLFTLLVASSSVCIDAGICLVLFLLEIVCIFCVLVFCALQKWEMFHLS